MWPTLPTQASNCNFSVSKDLVYSLQPSLAPWTNTYWQSPQTNSTVSSAPSIGLLALSSCSVFIWSHNQQHSSPQPTRQSLLAPNHDSWQQAPPTIVCIAACPNHSSHLSMHVPITLLSPLSIAVATPTSLCFGNPDNQFVWYSHHSMTHEIMTIHCFCNLYRPFATANPATKCSGNPIILWCMQSQLSIASSILTFHSFSNTNNQMHLQPHHSMACSTPTIHCFCNPNIQMHLQPHHSMACSTPTIHCFCNPNIPLLQQSQQPNSLAIPSFCGLFNPYYTLL